MYKTNFNFDLETIKGRSDAILKAIEIFGSESVILKRSDSLTYIFDNVVEAILFIISSTKEDEEIVESFTRCEIIEINISKHIFISTALGGRNYSSYIITNIESLKFTEFIPKSDKRILSDNIKSDIISDIGDLKISKYLNPARVNNEHVANVLNKHIGKHCWKKWWLELTPPEKINLCIETDNGDTITIPYTR